MTKNHFSTLAEGLDAVRLLLTVTNSTLADAEYFFNHFCMGGVNYGETKTRAGLLMTHRGKEITGRMAKRGLHVSAYRMESGTYEIIAYIS